MFDDPSDSTPDRPFDPAVRAREKSDEFRMHAELCAVFEGVRKFDAEIRTKLDPQIARDTQRAIGKLEKSKSAEHAVLPETSIEDAKGVLELPRTKSLSTNDYHIHHRPGEVMILRCLEGEQVDSFYTRLQAHFDVALNQYRDDEKSTHGWKQEKKMQAYLESLDKLEVRMADRYLREIIQKHNAFVLSTQSADEMDIMHLCDFIMGVPAAEIVGGASAPPDEPTERDRAWFFKLFSLRGIVDGVEKICFFTYLQKSDDAF
jgi:hypothetical protein